MWGARRERTNSHTEALQPFRPHKASWVHRAEASLGGQRLGDTTPDSHPAQPSSAQQGGEWAPRAQQVAVFSTFSGQGQGKHITGFYAKALEGSQSCAHGYLLRLYQKFRERFPSFHLHCALRATWALSPAGCPVWTPPLTSLPAARRPASRVPALLPAPGRRRSPSKVTVGLFGTGI